ncbi:MAG TPA: zinc-dependent peptidase [Saprospiraceae bacterium]|nr:zinc-dependent peptidase [Saprospiraceae bacterium]HMQ82521.1 zinc-dependent peptidase [Saprospiraceae bacterium]
MASKILAIPFVLAALVFLYLTWEVDSRYSWYIVPFVVALALVFVLSPQIDWWWHKKCPPRLRPKIQGLLERFLPYYQKLSESEKQRFRDRVALYMMANDFQAKGMDDPPADLKAVVAACAVQLSFGYPDFLLSPFEYIIFYPQPFPSPQYPEHFHASEIYEEDGVMIFSAEQLMKGFLQPAQFYNIGLHECAKAWERIHHQQDWPELGAEIWDSLQAISGFSQEAIQRWINLEPIPARPVSIVLFFTFPERFQQVLPELYQRYSVIFNQDTINGKHPVLKEIAVN